MCNLRRLGVPEKGAGASQYPIAMKNNRVVWWLVVVVGAMLFCCTLAQGQALQSLFSDPFGANPQGGLEQGDYGSFYGTTYSGGANGSGTIFKVTPGGAVTANTVPVTASLNSVGTGAIYFTVTDGFGGTADGCVIVTVVDKTPPTFTSVPNVTVEAPSGFTEMPVIYCRPIATDNIEGVWVSENFPSGWTFPVGETVVTCVATDAAGNTATASFTVTVLAGDTASSPNGTKGGRRCLVREIPASAFRPAQSGRIWVCRAQQSQGMLASRPR